MKKILILYASIGLGHKSIAENIGFYLQRAGFEVVLFDAQKVQGGFLAKWGKRVYIFLLSTFPFVWDWLYNTRWFITLTLPYRLWVAGHNYNHILKEVQQIKPDAIISTHATSSGVVAYLKKRKLYQGVFGIAFSDFHLHRYWLYGEADFYLPNIEEQKKEMISLGIPESKIFVCGMALAPKVLVDINTARTKFGIEAQEKVILVSSGSQGTEINEGLIQDLIKVPKVRVIAVCGKNKELFEKLSQKFQGTRALILSYHTPMDELYAVSSVVISKPGGLSTAEALRWGLPIIISHMLPGQEHHNYEYLKKQELILSLDQPVAEIALKEIESGNFANQLRNNPNLSKLLINEGALLQSIKRHV